MTVLRSMIFVPGYKEKFLNSAISSDADSLILDIEDSVPFGYKDEARRNIKNFLNENAFPRDVYVRVNSFDSGLLSRDLEAAINENTTGFMFPKINNERDIYYFDKMLTQIEMDRNMEIGKFKMCPLIETGAAILNALEIATASERITAMAFGGEDYLTDLDGLHKEHGTSLLVPRSLIVIAARTAGIEVLDTPYLNVKDIEGLRKELSLAKELGFSGALLLHPGQIGPANEIFSPSKTEIENALRLIDAIEKSKKTGSAVTLIDGQLVGPPMLKRAEKIISKYNKLKSNNGNR
jgi:citrate lyase subunit beta/citryl-CoA lyase